jgi:putative transcriptional regulator
MKRLFDGQADVGRHEAQGANMANSLADRVLQRLKGFTEALERGDNIGQHFTCRQIELDLKPKHYDAKKVKATRALLRLSQGMFATLLGVSPRTVQAWEQGENVPSDMACRFMDEIQLNPKYWRKRIERSTRLKKPVVR